MVTKREDGGHMIVGRGLSKGRGGQLNFVGIEVMEAAWLIREKMEAIL